MIMNYGVLVLGATIQISLFLRLCSVSAEIIYDPDTFRLPFLAPQSQDEFHEAIGFSPTVYSWLTGKRNYVEEKIMWDLFAPKSTEEEDMLRIFMEGRKSYRFMKSGSKMATWKNEDISNEKSGLGIEDYCESFDDTNAKFHQFKIESQERRRRKAEHQQRIVYEFAKINIDSDYDADGNKTETGPKTGPELDLPPGCFYYNGNTFYQTYLVCNDPSIKELPTIPKKLDFFEMNSTNVVAINNGSFNEVQIRGMRLNKNKISAVAPHAFEGISGLTNLEISYNQICWIWFEFILGLNDAHTLLLESNDICLDRPELVNTNRTVDDFDLTLTSLKFLSMKTNPMKVIPEMFFASLRESPIGYLSLQGCQLYYIHPEAFIHLKQLLILDLSENPKLTANLTIAFQGLRNIPLRSLTMVRNSLQEVPIEPLNIVSEYLQELDLHDNHFLGSINRNTFPVSMPKMKSLNLENCQITSIGLNSFDSMPNLVDLILKQNRLNVIPPAITNLVKLSVLDISKQDGRPFNILPDTFINLKNLRILFLSNLNIQVLEKSALKGLIGLNMLLLGNSEITDVEDFTFEGLKTLRTLDLRQNKFKSINSNTFYGLGNLQNLYLQDCNISIPLDKSKNPGSSPPIMTPTTEMSPANTNLDIEVLNGKLIIQKPVIDFATTSRAINAVIKSACGEEEVPVGSTTEPFKYLIRLQYLDLSYNYIRDLSQQLFSTMTYLHHLDLTKNAIELWRERIFGNNTALEKLHLPNNNIITITDAMIADLQNVYWMPFLDLSGNPFICDKGMCNLKEEVMNNSILLEFWDTYNKYTCTIQNTWERIELSALNNTYCNPSTEAVSSPDLSRTTNPAPLTLPASETTTTIDRIENKDLDPDTLSATLITIVIVVCCALLIICISVVVYKNRNNFKYFWFAAKFNVRRAGSHKSASSDLISESQTHDFDVFISYSHHDSEFIQDNLVPELEGTGKMLDGARNEGKTTTTSIQMDSNSNFDTFKVCLHERDFEVGTPITENIIECVDRSRKVIVLVSKHYLVSQWCLYEMNLAYHRLIESRRKSFLVIVLEEVPSELKTKILNYLMRSRTYIQWPGNDASTGEKKLFWARLRSSLASDD